MLIAGPLIRVLGDRYGWHVKVATLEALIQLVRKVRVKGTMCTVWMENILAGSLCRKGAHCSIDDMTMMLPLCDILYDLLHPF